MALSTCSELKEAVATWLARSGDTQITTNVADFVTLAEAYLNRTLRVRQMETVSSFSTTSGTTNLPDDYLAWRRMTYMGDTHVSLEYLNPDVFKRYHPVAEEGIPRSFTIEGGDIYIRPYTDAAEEEAADHEFLYYAKLAPLEGDDDTNWLLDTHPDLYLAAALAEANSFLLNAEHAGLWSQKRDAIVDQIMALSEKTKGPSRITPVGSSMY